MKTKKRSVCPVACALDLFGDRWTLLLVRDLACGKQTFGDFHRSPERIATNVLADRLQRMVHAGLVEKFTMAQSPPREAYRLTAKGESLRPILSAVAEWGLANVPGTKAVLAPGK